MCESHQTDLSSPSPSASSCSSANSPGMSGSMQPIIFYTSRTTPSCRAVKMVATHLNIPMHEIPLQCYIDTRTEQFRKINPCHTLPVINDHGFILWESRAIMQYLCNQYAPDSSLYPREPQKRATVDRLLNFDLKTLSHAVIAVHYEFMFPSEYSASRGEKLIAVTDALTLLEIFLINKNYVACEHLTIADISIVASVTLLEIAVEFDLTCYPNIWNWFNRLRNELPYYDLITKVAHDELRALIQSVRDADEEWSTPVPHCAFTPNNSSCIEEQRSQYQRLFLNAKEKRDAARIMAAVTPVFRNRRRSDGLAAVKAAMIATKEIYNGHGIVHSETVHGTQNDSQDERKRKMSNQQKAYALEQGCAKSAQPFMKRIRLTIEPNTGQSLQLSHFESTIIE